jgi:hypothetical protein
MKLADRNLQRGAIASYLKIGLIRKQMALSQPFQTEVLFEVL